MPPFPWPSSQDPCSFHSLPEQFKARLATGFERLTSCLLADLFSCDGSDLQQASSERTVRLSQATTVPSISIYICGTETSYKIFLHVDSCHDNLG